MTKEIIQKMQLVVRNTVDKYDGIKIIQLYDNSQYIMFNFNMYGNFNSKGDILNISFPNLNTTISLEVVNKPDIPDDDFRKFFSLCNFSNRNHLKITKFKKDYLLEIETYRPTKLELLSFFDDML